MSDRDTLTEVIQIISKFAERREALAQANASTNILDDLGVSSLNLVEVVLEFEEQFSISISDDQLKRISTIGDCVNVIASAQAAR